MSILYSEEIDTLYPKDKNGVLFAEDSPIQGTYSAKDYCEILKVQDALVLAEYTSDFYANTPAITVKQTGKGKAYYVAARSGQDFYRDFLKKLPSLQISTTMMPMHLPL